ncbi:MAG: exonuclease SbcCD subunit D [Candidatus Obscuribacter phosphatis]|uniref:Nuclease SbcCD subunit D n=1 Tax=Candidatus Obscuribacter phosphatis TaxID=1906157 RepID=A0A8J7TMW8_9BACT|nr:exonuclease SbcCD subunit D [Candidatus Obscuribacter phosphatis]
MATDSDKNRNINKITMVHVSDIHFGSGESHGRLNPDTGLNIRFEDFVLALRKAVDYTIENQIDVFLFSGDAYRNASPEPIYQKMFARELNRLSKHEVKTILVVGNHDQLLRSTQSHAMSVFQSLEVPDMLIVDKPMMLEIETKHGPFQLIGLPHITRHNLASLEKYKDASAQEIDRVLAQHVESLLAGFFSKLDKSKPCVVTAHMSTDKALAGIEEELLVGYTMTFPTEMFIYDCVDYVALGHIHKYQILREKDPAIVYAGSLERVDFGEEKEDKGFVKVDLIRGATTFSYQSISPRPFITVELDLTKNRENLESDRLTEKLIQALRREILPGCVLRLKCKIGAEDLKQINEDRLKESVSEALSFKLQLEVVPEHARSRIPQLTEASVLSPIKALDTYLSEVAPDRKERLLERTRLMMNKLAAETGSETL